MVAGRCVLVGWLLAIMATALKGIQATRCNEWEPCSGVRLTARDAIARKVRDFGIFRLSRSFTRRHKSPVYIALRKLGNPLFL